MPVRHRRRRPYPVRAQARVSEPAKVRGTRAEQWAERRFSGKALRPRNAAYLVAGFWIFGVFVFGVIERIADPHTFTSVWLAFWWAIQTVTTVGYGDVVPTQTSGKVLAAILMLGGLSFLSIVTATITSAFVARRQAELRDAGRDPVMKQLDQIATRLDRIEGELRRPPGRGEPT
jgi:voltage-gated potassium channel